MVDDAERERAFGRELIITGQQLLGHLRPATQFLIPWNFGGRRPRSGVKNRRDRLVLNRVARSVIEDQRGQDHVWVFPLGGKPVQQILQKALCLARQRAAERWRELRKEPAPAGFAKLRVHDLKHTFGHRLEAAGVSDRDCQALLGHARRGITPQYMAPEVARLLQSAESVLGTERHGTIPLTIIRRKVA